MNELVVCLRETAHVHHDPRAVLDGSCRSDDRTHGAGRTFRESLYRALSDWLHPDEGAWTSLPEQKRWLVEAAALPILTYSWDDIALIQDIGGRGAEIQSVDFIVDSLASRKRAGDLGGAFGIPSRLRGDGDQGNARRSRWAGVAVQDRMRTGRDVVAAAALPSQIEGSIILLAGDGRVWRHLAPVADELGSRGQPFTILSTRLAVWRALRAEGHRSHLVRPVMTSSTWLEAALPHLAINMEMSDWAKDALRRLLLIRSRPWLPRVAGIANAVSRVAGQTPFAPVALHAHEYHPEAHALAIATHRYSGKAYATPHGLIDPYAPEVSHYPKLDGYLTWGPLDSEALGAHDPRLGYAVWPVGSVVMERWLQQLPTEPEPGDAILIVFGRPSKIVRIDAFLAATDEVLDAARRMPARSFQIKPHPADRSEFWSTMASRFPPNVSVVGGDYHDRLREAAVVVTMHSTAGAEAICAGVPVVAIDLRSADDDAGRDPAFVSEGAAYHVQEAGDLLHTLEAILERPPGQDALVAARRRFSSRFLVRDERTTAARLADLLTVGRERPK